tara:strand:+ start:164220 stop:165335 length:1116 start_codon:yes stop_codon:yes gene_type:complete
LNIKLFFSLIFLVLLSNCGESDGEAPFIPSSCSEGVVGPDILADTASLASLNTGCFTASGSTPIFQSGDLFTNAQWNDPHVFKMNGEYVMYASASTGFDGNVKIYRLVSSNRTSWTLSPSGPVFQKAKSGFSAKSVETPGIVFFKGTWHMFYTAYETDYTNVNEYRVGHAYSCDGINWIRNPNPIISPTHPNTTAAQDSDGDGEYDFNQYLVAEPAPVVFNDKLYLYYSTQGYYSVVADQLQSIGVVTSSDGFSWSDQQVAVRPDQTSWPRATYKGFSTPNAIVIQNRMHLFFTVVDASDNHQARLGYAYSTDGLSSWTQPAGSIFQDSDFTWTSREVRSPSMLIEGSTLHMWFAGDDSSTLGVGYATCSL